MIDRSARRVISLAPMALALTACSSLPWTDHGAPPPVCGQAFAPGADLEWSGRGNPVALGLYDVAAGSEHTVRDGDIYIGPVNIAMGPEWGSARAFCVVYSDGSDIGPVPDGWERP